MLVLMLTRKEVVVLRTTTEEIVLRLGPDQSQVKICIQAPRDTVSVDREPVENYPLPGKGNG